MPLTRWSKFNKELSNDPEDVLSVLTNFHRIITQVIREEIQAQWGEAWKDEDTFPLTLQHCIHTKKLSSLRSGVEFDMNDIFYEFKYLHHF